MAYNLVVTDEAEKRIDRLSGYLIYKLKNPDAAIHFLDELQKVYDRLEDNPEQFPESHDRYLCQREYREALLQEMKYRVLFRIEGTTVYISGVFHDLEDYVKKVN